eukprot:scaffold289563_cov34-Prasinocladus_malaysianus.AAC.1
MHVTQTTCQVQPPKWEYLPLCIPQAQIVQHPGPVPSQSRRPVHRQVRPDRLQPVSESAVAHLQITNTTGGWQARILDKSEYVSDLVISDYISDLVI